MSKKIIIFDMDGTLINSAKDITSSINYVRKENHNLDALSEQFVIDIINKHHNALINIPVPDTLSEIHLSIANDYFVYAQTLKNIDKYQNDPVKAMVSIREVETIQRQQEESFATLASFFREHGIIFNESDAGILWNQY